MINGWLRPMRREAWALASDWRKVLKFMSVQAAILLTVVPAIFTAYGFPFWVSMGSAALFLALVVLGAVIKQPELEE